MYTFCFYAKWSSILYVKCTSELAADVLFDIYRYRYIIGVWGWWVKFLDQLLGSIASLTGLRH